MTNARIAALLTLLVLLNLCSIPACGSTSEGERLLDPGEPQQNEPQSARPAVLIENRAFSREALWDVMAEIAGKEAVRETVLDHAVARELERAGLVIREADIDAERERLYSRLAPDADESRTNEIVGRVLDRRGIGPTRLGRLLSRNAGMRKLIADESEPSAEMIELAHEIRYGRTLDTRMIMTNSINSARSARNDVLKHADERGLSLAFAEVAREQSIDPSSSLGGDMGALSPEDPGLPIAIRREMSTIEPMTLSDIIALDDGFAIILIENENEAQDVPFESVYDELLIEVRDRQERLLMNRLAERLIAEYAPSVLDASLRWSWEH